MKYLITFLMGFMLGLYLPSAVAGEVTVSWEWPTEREDGELIKQGELSHVKIYFHDVPNNHWTEEKVLAPATSITVIKPNGNYEIFATAVDTGMRESKPSNKYQHIITDKPIIIDLSPPSPPTILIEL